MVTKQLLPPVCINSYIRFIAVVFHEGDVPMLIFACICDGYVPPGDKSNCCKLVSKSIRRIGYKGCAFNNPGYIACSNGGGICTHGKGFHRRAVPHIKAAFGSRRICALQIKDSVYSKITAGGNTTCTING